MQKITFETAGLTQYQINLIPAGVQGILNTRQVKSTFVDCTDGVCVIEAEREVVITRAELLGKMQEQETARQIAAQNERNDALLLVEGEVDQPEI